MGFVEEELWKCRCGFEFIANSGVYEADPNDFGTSHIISGYHCPKCGQVKNIASHSSLDKPLECNKNLCVNESDICDNCGTKMQYMNKPRFRFFSNGLLCPKCKKIRLKFKKTLDNWCI